MFLFVLPLCVSQNITNTSEFEDFNITNTSEFEDFNITNTSEFEDFNITNTSEFEDFNITNTSEFEDFTNTTNDHTDDEFPYVPVIILSVLCIPVVCYLFACVAHCCTVWYECEIQIKRKPRKHRNVYPGIRRSDAKYLNAMNRENEKYEQHELPDCSICLEPVKNSKTSSVTLDCGHRFHTKCINGWIMSQLNSDMQVTCPTCKQTFTIKPPQPEPQWYPSYSSDDSYDEY